MTNSIEISRQALLVFLPGALALSTIVASQANDAQGDVSEHERLASTSRSNAPGPSRLYLNMGAAIKECSADIHRDFIGTSCNAFLDSEPEQTTYASVQACAEGEKGELEWGDFEPAVKICGCAFDRAWDRGLDDVEFLTSGKTYADNDVISDAWIECRKESSI